MGKGLLCP